MNWDAIGAVGEMIGALAVVVTLAYLALQVRASTKESEANHFSVFAGQYSEMRSRFMEHADVWIKGTAGNELSLSERFVFDELVALKNSQHFFNFSRTMVRGTGRERRQVAEMASFLHQHPVAYRSWRSQQEVVHLTRRQLGVSVDDPWARAVTEAVAALEGMEEPAVA
jgi:hypothetical protein